MTNRDKRFIRPHSVCLLLLSLLNLITIVQNYDLSKGIIFFCLNAKDLLENNL